MKITKAERIAILLTLLLVVFFAGFYAHGALAGGELVVEPERRLEATAEQSGDPVATPIVQTLTVTESSDEELPERNTPENLEDDGKIDLNHATQAQLETLPGIGPVLGQKIIAYREEHGSFHSVEEIMNVSGIGEKTYLKLKDQVKVGNSE